MCKCQRPAPITSEPLDAWGILTFCIIIGLFIYLHNAFMKNNEKEKNEWEQKKIENANYFNQMRIKMYELEKK